MNTENGEFYNEEERIELVLKELFSDLDFILLPQVSLIEIKRSYLGDKKFKHWDNDKFESFFSRKC